MKKVLPVILMLGGMPAMAATVADPYDCFDKLGAVCDKMVSITRIYKIVVDYDSLYDSDFVFFLRDKGCSKECKLLDLAQLCMDYIGYNPNVDADICKSFIDDIIGVPVADAPAVDKNPGGGDSSRKPGDRDKAIVIPDPNAECKGGFEVTTTKDTKRFGFELNAGGDFTICWGDGHVQPVSQDRVDDGNRFIEHDYSKAGSYKVMISGQATGYPRKLWGNSIPAGQMSLPMVPKWIPAISFRGNYAGNVAGIKGSLAKIFSSIPSQGSDGLQPSFNETFKGCKNLKGTIPSNIFDGLSGYASCAESNDMFKEMFSGCSALTGDSAKVNGHPLYQWSGVGFRINDFCGKGMYEGATKLNDYNSIPKRWK